MRDMMPDAELLEYMGDDASKWAEEFCKIARDLGHNIDEGWMIGWFANAIEHSYAVRMRRISGELTAEDLEAIIQGYEELNKSGILPQGEVRVSESG